MNIRKLGLAALAAASALTLAACGASTPGNGGSAPEQPGADEVIKIRIQGQPSIAAEPMYMAIDNGFFEEEGLEIEVVDIADAAGGFAAVQSGQLELAFSPTIGVLQAARQNLPLVMVAPSDGLNPAAVGVSVEEGRNYTGVGIYTSKESGITDIAGLQGASISVPELKSQPDATITAVMQDNGYDTDGIEWLALSFVPALDALKNGTLDAAFLVSPFTLEADEAGLARVMNPSIDFFPEGAVTTAWIGSQSWVEGNPEAVARFQRALAKSAAWANENLTATQEHVIERSGLTLNPDQMPQTYWPTAFNIDAMKEIDRKLVGIGFFEGEVDMDELIASSAN